MTRCFIKNCNQTGVFYQRSDLHDRNTGEPYYRKHYNEEDIDYEYVIFYDDTDFLLGQKDNFIKVNQNTGLTKREINKAIKILTRLK